VIEKEIPMSELHVETLIMPAGDLGPENPLPPFKNPREMPELEHEMPGIPEDTLKNMSYGQVSSLLPYTLQDGYTRERRPRDFRVAVLENEFLRATFLLELGGRLWSLIHKPSGRELLSVNPVFQPANLAMRNAWFSGGVEWNIGTISHNLLGCQPIFAARVAGPNGTPILRLYEFERIRQTPFQIDAYLPDGSPVLFVRIRITNPHNRETPMYWWSNIAVPETPDTRVIVPANRAYLHGIQHEGLKVVQIPVSEGIDVTYPANHQDAASLFFHILEGHRPWIAALNKDAKGLVQFSTGRLKGRKFFVWGMSPGGRTWQEFLSVPGQTYLEIQAGLARTQLEHLPMPARTEWTWLEGYGLMEADPAAVRGTDWTRAQQAVEDRLERLIPRAALDAELEHSAQWADRPPDEILLRGSGWGALERLRREAAGEPPFCSAGLVFDDQSLREAQTPWVTLLRRGSFPEAESGTIPSGYLVDHIWRTLLEAAAKQQAEMGWLAWLHLGVMRYYAGDREGARQAWEKSAECAATPWALRNLAVMKRDENQLDEAAKLYLQAHRLLPSLLPLSVETAQILLDSHQPQVWLDLLPRLPESHRKKGRIRLLEGQAALAVGDLERVERLLSDRFVVDDLREGERSLSDLWFDYQELRLSIAEHTPIDSQLRSRVRREFPVPKEIDFRMTSEELHPVE
jgi:tetratricopeptide (TPR) repeat protein